MEKTIELRRKRTAVKRYKIAAALMFLHGAVMEIGGCLALVPILLLGQEAAGTSSTFSFIVPYFNENMNLMLAAGVIYGALRIVGAIGLWRNKRWGLAISAVNCVLTLVLMMFMLPAGILDGLLAGAALILMLTQFFGDQKIIEKE